MTTRRPEDSPLDWSVDLDPQELQRLVGAYADTHGGSTLNRFVSFMAKLRPDAFKRYRLWVETVPRGRGLQTRGSFIQPLLIHYYTVIRYALGLLYMIHFGRRDGLSRHEVADIFTLAWLTAGPPAANFAATEAEQYMDLWASLQPDEEQTSFAWPPDWKIDPSAFESGIETNGAGDDGALTNRDLALLREWHLRVEGEVPGYVEFLARHYPLALKTYRARYEQTMKGRLPKQFVAMCLLQLAMSAGDPDSLRRSLHMAKVFGVSKGQLVQMIALTQMFVGDVRLDAVIAVISRELETWP